MPDQLLSGGQRINQNRCAPKEVLPVLDVDQPYLFAKGYARSLIVGEIGYGAGLCKETRFLRWTRWSKSILYIFIYIFWVQERGRGGKVSMTGVADRW